MEKTLLELSEEHTSCHFTTAMTIRTASRRCDIPISISSATRYLEDQYRGGYLDRVTIWDPNRKIKAYRVK